MRDSGERERPLTPAEDAGAHHRASNIASLAEFRNRSAKECATFLQGRFRPTCRMEEFETHCLAVKVAFVFLDDHGARIADIIKYHDGACALTFADDEPLETRLPQALRLLHQHGLIRPIIRIKCA